MANDLIDRQAAIDALTHKWDGMVTSVFDVVNSLPSAQPEIIRCKDCKHYNAGFECLIEGYGIERNKDWYCGNAERKTDG